jgi:hypothetical protein
MFSGLLYILKIVFPLSNHLPVKHGGYVPPTLKLDSYSICQNNGIIHYIPVLSLEKSPIISALIGWSFQCRSSVYCDVGTQFNYRSD